jgi:hypothetical protein
MKRGLIRAGLPLVVALMATPVFAGIQFSSEAAFQAALAQMNTIDWDGISTGATGIATLTGNEYVGEFGGPTLAVDASSDLFVISPQTGGPFGADFFPTSSDNVFSPDDSGSPEGILTITFNQTMHGIGAWFLDVESDFAVTGITVNKNNYRFAADQGDNTQSFLGVIDAAGFTSADIYMAFDQGAVNGVGIDDLQYGVVPAPGAALLGLIGCGAISALRRRVG